MVGKRQNSFPTLPNWKLIYYRSIDVSTLKELAVRWAPNLKDGFKKETKHEAFADILESIEELRYYREHFIKCSSL